MLTVRSQKSLRHAKEYFREHLAQGDYHSQRQAIAGQWHGKGVERLGLSGQPVVAEAQFVRLCDNLHPITGAKLTVRSRKDRRVFYDFVVSAPKSISILAVTMGDLRLVAAHDAACLEVFAELEKAAGARVRKGGQRSMRSTKETVAASFRHNCSRALDPQLHTHFVVFNATWDGSEKRWKALEPEQMFAQATYLTEVYRNALAASVRRIGYTTRPARHGFEIEGVSEEILQRFSKRSGIIREAEAKLEARLGHPLSKNSRAALAHSTRARKPLDLGASQLVALHQSQVSAVELDRLRKLVPETTVPISKASSLTPELARTALAAARDHVFERLSVAPEHELLRHALAFSRGSSTLEELRKAMALDPELIRREGQVTTRTVLALERKLVDLVNRGIGAYGKLCSGQVTNTTLTEEQRQAVERILRSRDGVVCLRGGAGTGKTTTLKEITKALEMDGKPVALFAPNAGAVEVLRQEGFGQVDTVQRLLVDSQMQHSHRGHVYIVDEAGLLSVGQMHALVEMGRRNGNRILLSGDSRQHSSVEAGDGLRLPEEHTQMQTVELKSIRRQVSLEYRQAIADVAAGRGLLGLGRLEALGAIHESTGEERYTHLAKQYVGSLKEGKEALVVSPTWREVALVTDALRRALVEEGRLTGKPNTVQVVKSEQWTGAQRADLAGYRSDHVLVFHRETRDFARGESARVLSATPHALVVARQDGRHVTLTRKQKDCYEVGTLRQLELLSGDKLLIQGNRRDARLLNGQIVTVERVEKNGSVRLNDGRVIPHDFRQFTYGYCVTSPASQGKTADHMYVAMDAASGLAANRKQFYVSASRGRERIRIYTDDRDHLREAVQTPGDRLLASELMRIKPSVEESMRRHSKIKVRL